MKVISSLLLAVAVGSSKVRFAVAEDKPACGEAYTCSNGNTAGPVVDADSCQEACESCEGKRRRLRAFPNLDLFESKISILSLR